MTDEAAQPFRRIAIVGLGLMGGSLARALALLRKPPAVYASSREADELHRARAEGVVERATRDPVEIVGEAELVVYATPASAAVELLSEHRDAWRPDAVITDVCSVKRAIMARAEAVGIGARFVGGHPMTGGHGSGLAAARPDLYRGARVWLCVRDRRPDGAESGAGSPDARVAALWRAVGADPAWIDAATHDRLVAWSSHLPQITASALAVALAEAGISPDALGSGGRDTTRLAGSPPALWRDILLHNRDELGAPTAALVRVLEGLAAALEAADGARLEELLAAGRRWRDPE